MGNHARSLLVGVIAVAVCGLTGGAAVALRSLEFSARESLRAGMNGTLLFTNEAGLGVTECEIVLITTLHRAVSKIKGALLGTLGSVAVGLGCEGPQVSVLRETLPWHITYQSFSGTLPGISAVGISVTGVALQYESFGARCLYRGNLTASAVGNPFVELVFEGESLLGRFSGPGSPICQSVLRVFGALRFRERVSTRLL